MDDVLNCDEVVAWEYTKGRMRFTVCTRCIEEEGLDWDYCENPLTHSDIDVVEKCEMCGRPL